MKFVQKYIENIQRRYKQGNSTEHTFRGDLQQLIEEVNPNIYATNEPKRQKCGAPDYVLTQKEIPIGYIEAKDIGIDLGSKSHKEQFDRYKTSLNNLIFTDYLDFWLYRNGEFVNSIQLGKIENNEVISFPEKFDDFNVFLQNFCVHNGQTIKSSKKLATLMANKAKMLALVIEKALLSDEESKENSDLKTQMIAFQEILIHDIKAKDFADIYAQTIAYGMFVARLHDTTLDTFSRQEAAELIPKTNPFLRKLFQYISGYDIDSRIEWIVSDLADIFKATNVKKILNFFGKETQTHDPIIHFYETFLAEYDPQLRKSRGVWYTPEPVVKFIVKSVDDILKTEFGLSQGLADTSKTKIKVDSQNIDKRSSTGYKQEIQEVHKVQILDPAAGTGTFIAETVKHIYQKFKGQEGIWSNYVENHLIPRLNGFELLMASYTMAHLQLDLLLNETGYQPQKEQRFRIYLTNSLEEYHKDTGTLFANWLSSEANEANYVKQNTPVMCIIGNPPYSGSSMNKGEWIMNLMDDYKKEPQGKEKLKERNPKWINDDYVKFIRFGQYFIEKNKEGILAFITPHGFLDNPTFRGMRWNLLKTYDKIYTIDLHGNANKKEKCPDGSKDENVFDILQGVSINFFIKTNQKHHKELGKVYHYDLYGKRKHKYSFLNTKSLQSIPFTELPNIEPMYFMVPNYTQSDTSYQKGFAIDEVFQLKSMGIVTSRDEFVLDTQKNRLSDRVQDFFKLPAQEAIKKYSLKEKKDWTVLNIQNNAATFSQDKIKKIAHKLFDIQYIYYDDDFVERNRRSLMQHFFEDNIGLVVPKSPKTDYCFFLSKHMITHKLCGPADSNYLFPLYEYLPQSSLTNEKRKPNLNPKIIQKISKVLNLQFTFEKESTNSTFAPIDLLDYIYSILYNTQYRKQYKEHLKEGFPKIPYPNNQNDFWEMVKVGSQLRKIHLMEDESLNEYISSYPITGDNKITRNITKKDWELYDQEQQLGRIWINDTQYFDKIPNIVWNLYIGGYQPAQKWLKDRKNSELSFEEILHYQKVLVALFKTHNIISIN